MASYHVHGERESPYCTDASNTGWGGILFLPEAPKETRDYWSPDDVEVSGGIAVKKAKTLYQTLSIFYSELAYGRVDAYVDNPNLIGFWNNEGGRNIILTNEDLFLSMELDIALNMSYVPSELNMADPLLDLTPIWLILCLFQHGI